MTKKCPEIRSRKIGKFLISNGKTTNWDSGNPHKLELIRIVESENEWILKINN